MTLITVLVVAPFGGLTDLCPREYAEQGKLASIVRISVNPRKGTVH
jgi:ABC-type phosphate transport system permease subunit